MNTEKSEMQKMQEKINLLMKVADKGRLKRLMPEAEVGKEVRVSLYKAEIDSAPRLVIGWKLIKDFVRTTRKDGVIEEQTVEIKLDGEGHSRMGIIKQSIIRMKDAEKIAELEKEYTMLYNKDYIQIPLADFATTFDKEMVQVKETKVDTKTGDVSFVFDWNEKEYSLSDSFIN